MKPGCTVAAGLQAEAGVVVGVYRVEGVDVGVGGAAGVLGLLEIVFGVLFGVLFFHEHPNAISLAGVAIIILAAAIPYLKDYNARRGTLD